MSFITPPNVSFEIDDLEETWTYSEKFDLIHARMMTGSIQDCPKFFAQAFANLTPGGYIELCDSVFLMRCDDSTMGPDSAVYRWSKLMLDTCAKIGRHNDSALGYKEHLEKASFVDIVETQYKWPINHWPKDPKYKEIGLWCNENVLGGLSGLSMALFTRVLGMTTEEVEAYLIDVRKEMKNPKIHSYIQVYTFYTRKPLAA